MDNEPADDLEEILGLRREKHKSHSFFHIKEKGNVGEARKRIDVLISQFKKMSPLDLTKLKNPRLLQTWERLNNAFVGLPSWESLLMAAQDDFRMGESGNIVVLINPAESNKNRLMVRSLTDRTLFNDAKTSTDHLYGLEVNAQNLIGDSGTIDEVQLKEDFFESLLEVQSSLHYNNSVRPISIGQSEPVLTRGQVRSLFHKGFRPGGNNRSVGMTAPNMQIL